MIIEDFKIGDKWVKFYNIENGVVWSKSGLLHSSMMLRCKDNSSAQKKRNRYIGCEVSDNFKNFQYFAEWCNSQIGYSEAGYQLDKDILLKGNKIYGEDFCCFVPAELNSLFCKANIRRGKYLIGVDFRECYKKFRASCRVNGKQKHLGYFKTELEAFYAYKYSKEQYIKTLAEKYKCCISQKVYEALINYQVNIGD